MTSSGWQYAIALRNTNWEGTVKMIKRALTCLLMALGLTALASNSFADEKKTADPQTPPAKVKKVKKPKHIDLVMILDQSGSMHSLTSDTIGGYNSMVDKQRKAGIPVSVTTVLFNNEEKTLYNRKPIAEVPALTNAEYAPQNMTALLDATGNTLNRMKSTKGVNAKNNKVIVVLITDGLENASKEYKRDDVKKIISDLQEKNGWEFIFLGANIDAAAEAGSIGIKSSNAVKYKNTGTGVKANYEAVGTMMEEAAMAVPEEERTWKSKVEKAD